MVFRVKTSLMIFFKRHLSISRRITQNSTSRISEITEEKKRRSWFHPVRNYFEKTQVIDVLNHPSCIFNCDEISFFSNPKEKDVLVKKQ